MYSIRLILFNLFIISTAVLCFEIIATRISSVIFVNNFAFIILSLAILGLGTGGIFTYYRFKPYVKKKNKDIAKDPAQVLPVILAGLGISVLLFILAVTRLQAIENPAVFFTLLFIPFFIAGIFYALVFKMYAAHSFSIYAADLCGAAAGALIAIVALTATGPVNSLLILILVIFGAAISFRISRKSRSLVAIAYVVIAVLIAVAGTGDTDMAGTIPVGDFPEKDIHHVYTDPDIASTITDSRWSIFGRSDLVSHSHQDFVRHLFIDGAAGSQMFRFNGDIQNPDRVVQNQLLGFTSTLPLLVLDDDEKANMLVIGPGGGKEVLAGLIFGVGRITGVEINSDFVDIVKSYRDYNGGIYTDFPNVQILVQEGRQYVKQKHSTYDLIVMVLPSTQQVQNIENYALSENYLLTVEALEDYLQVLTPGGRLVFTVYNEAELKRLIATTIRTMEKNGIPGNRSPYHFAVIEDPITPTLVIKKEPFTPEETGRYLDFMSQIPEGYPVFTYLPFLWHDLADTRVNRFLRDLYTGSSTLAELIESDPFDIAPVTDDSPYFYKIDRGIPSGFSWLLAGILGFNVLIVAVPYTLIRKSRKGKTAGRLQRDQVRKPLILFTCLGLGFMIMEVALFQKLILYLGTPTVSLSVLLSSLLIGMGLGSYSGGRFFPEKEQKRLIFFAGAISIVGLVIILTAPRLLDSLLVYILPLRAVVTFLVLLPFGFLLGIPFPTCVMMLKKEGLDPVIPWMYGVNGTMSVLGSILAVVISMIYGFTPAFFAGLAFYLLIMAYLMVPAGKAAEPDVNDTESLKVAPKM